MSSSLETISGWPADFRALVSDNDEGRTIDLSVGGLAESSFPDIELESKGSIHGIWAARAGGELQHFTFHDYERFREATSLLFEKYNLQHCFYDRMILLVDLSWAGIRRALIDMFVSGFFGRSG